MNREELALYTADVEANERLAKAKDAYRAHQTDKTRAEFRAAKEHLAALRLEWRTVRDAFKETVPTLTVKAKA